MISFLVKGQYCMIKHTCLSIKPDFMIWTLKKFKEQRNLCLGYPLKKQSTECKEPLKIVK